MDSADLNIVLVAFASTPAGDLDGDGITDSADLNLVLAAFGATGCGALPVPACCAPTGRPGCADGLCMDLVCGSDASCCTTEWDQACADSAQLVCPVCLAGINPCCYPHAGAGCSDAGCEALVCAQKPACCETEWDVQCSAWAFAVCAGTLCHGIYFGPCCEGHATPGCDDPACTELVCAEDAYCCDFIWDDVCADDALDLCGFCE